MITDDERFIKIVDILAFSDIHPNDCIKINDLIIDLSKQKDYLQSQVEKLTQENNDMEERICYLERSNNRKEETIIDLRMEQELDKYKDIIDKAIEYAKEHIRIDDEYPAYMEMLIEEYKELLEILRGKNE